MDTCNDNGNLHSFDDKPAVIWKDGTKEWYKDGKLHRDGGPFVIYIEEGEIKTFSEVV